MEIVVCIKQVPDPEAPSSCFVVHQDTKAVELRGVPPVLNPFDENALEAALRLKDEAAEAIQITLLTLGYRISNSLMLKALAAGADSLLKIEDEAFKSANLDGCATAWALALAIRKLGRVDLIVTGRQAADTNAGQVPYGVAHWLNMPAISQVKRICLDKGMVVVERILQKGKEKVRVPLPALLVVGGETGMLRYPSLPQIHAAKRRPVAVWKAEDIGFERSGGGAWAEMELRKLWSLELKRRSCVMVEGESPREAGRRLAERLRADKVL